MFQHVAMFASLLPTFWFFIYILQEFNNTVAILCTECLQHMVRCPSGVGYFAVKPGKTSSQEWDVTALEYKYYKLMSPCKLPLSFSICARKEI